MKRLLVVFAVLLLTPMVAMANTAGPGVDDTFGPYQWTPGDYIDTYNNLDAAIPADYDLAIFVLVGSGTFSQYVEDCCIMGDTMIDVGIVIDPSGRNIIRDTCTSPDTCNLTWNVSGFAIIIKIMGYTDCPGGFPAGYYWGASFY
jgi:hypothetical protein